MKSPSNVDGEGVAIEPPGVLSGPRLGPVRPLAGLAGGSDDQLREGVRHETLDGAEPSLGLLTTTANTPSRRPRLFQKYRAPALPPRLPQPRQLREAKLGSTRCLTTRCLPDRVNSTGARVSSGYRDLTCVGFSVRHGVITLTGVPSSTYAIDRAPS